MTPGRDEARGAVRLAGREALVRGLRRAAVERTPFAMGKLGTSEKYWMYLDVLRGQTRNLQQRRAFETALHFHAFRQSGVFPATTEFIAAFGREYVRSVRDLDFVGLMRDRLDLEDGIVAHYGLTNRFVHFLDQEPDRSVPAREAECYLPAFEGRTLLIVSPFADLLAERATCETFERVWRNIGKRWFHPASVDALVIPYGYESATEKRFGTALALEAHVERQLERRNFDVALIGAGGLGIPIAAACKRLGRIGLSLGGHVQVLFGVAGKRWHELPEWRETYINDAWIDMPARYRPRVEDGMVSDEGAYW